GQLPYEPGVHGSECKFAARRTLPCAWNMIEKPTYLAPGEISIRLQPGLLGDPFGMPIAYQRFTEIRCPAVLPDDGVIDRHARSTIPQQGSLPLIGNSDRGDVLRRKIRAGEGFAGGPYLRRPDLDRVVLHP